MSSNNGPKYPRITVQLSGKDGNAFVILGKISRELRRNGISKEEIDSFYKEATEGNYDHLLQMYMRWVSVQ